MTHAEADKAHSQGRISRSGARHALPARHQGRAQGDADGRRPAGDPACGRRGQGGRHRAFHLRHRPQQGGHRGPFRQPVRAGAHAGRAGQDERAGAAHGRAAAAPARPASRASRRRSASATQCGARARSSATSRSRCCCPTCCTTAAKPCLAEMMEAYEEHGGNHIAVAPVPEDQTHLYGIVGVEDADGQGLAHHRHGREAEARHGALQPAHYRPLHSAARDVRHPRARRARRRRRDPDHRRDDRACCAASRSSPCASTARSTTAAPSSAS